MLYMGKKKQNSDGPKRPDRHRKLQTQLRLDPRVREQLDILVDRRISTLTEEITEAIRKHLADNGLWPPPPEPS